MIKKILLLNLLVVGIGLIIMLTDDQKNCVDAACTNITYPIIMQYPPQWNTLPQYQPDGLLHGGQSALLPVLPPNMAAISTHRTCWLSTVSFGNFCGNTVSSTSPLCGDASTRWGTCEIENQSILKAPNNSTTIGCRATCMFW